MSYTKTTWNDLTAPAIDATNLNKIEQGIYDNSIDITSLNTLIGSSGTATTTQTDFTEGQLSQKLGLKYIKMKGQTSQYSTTGKNILENTLTQSTNEGITFTSNSDGSVTVNGTATGTALAWVNSNFTLPAGTYTLSGCPSGGSNNTYRLDINSGAYIDTGNGVTFTLSSETTITNVRMRIENGYTVNKIVFKPMIEKASAKTTYEPYTGGKASPNPSYPQDVNNVSGSNILKVCNKNLIDITCSNQSNRGIDLTNNNNGTVTLNGTATATSGSLSLFSSNTSVPVSSLSGTITFSTKEALPSGVELALAYGDSTGTWISNIARLDSTSHVKTATISPPSNAVYIRANFSITNGTAINNLVVSPQIEYGSTATTYVEHKEEDYNIDLPVENLLDYANNTIANASINTSGEIVTTSQCTTVWAKVKPNKTYTLSRDKGDRILIGGTNTQPALNGSTTLIKNEGVTDVKEYTFTNGNYNYIAIYISRYTSTKPNWVKLEENSKATAYMDYGEKSLELCKIGTYQDYIYKNNGKWYKYSEIGKVILDGINNSIGSKSATTSNNMYTTTNITGIKTVSANNKQGFAICSHLPLSITDTLYSQDVVGIGVRNNEQLTIGVGLSSDLTSKAIFNTWLQTHNITVYYALATPIEEEITYEPLLRQLDKLDKIGLYDISNISQDNSDMKMLLDFTICNDNYNGLREFIRA